MHQLFTIQLLKGCNHRQPTGEFRYQTILNEVFRLHIGQNLVDVLPFILADQISTETDTTPFRGPLFDDLFQAIEGTATDKQDIRGIDLEGCDIEFRTEALQAIAKKASERKTGARGLRSILEHRLLDTMYDLPSMEGIGKVVVDEGLINEESDPIFIYHGEKKRA